MQPEQRNQRLPYISKKSIKVLLETATNSLDDLFSYPLSFLPSSLVPTEDVLTNVVSSVRSDFLKQLLTSF